MPPELLPEPPSDRLLDDREAAELLSVKPSWVGEAARRGGLPHIMLGRYRRFDRADLLVWLEEQKRR
jgi:excisionase family DNA binding protein